MQNSSTTKGKSESVTFRIGSQGLKNLRYEAEQKDVSTNTLVNQIIKDHQNWHSTWSKSRFYICQETICFKGHKIST